MTGRLLSLPESLRYRLLLPVVVMAMLLGMLVSGYVYWFARDQLRTELSDRGRTIANSIVLASESMTSEADIKRYVTAMGADPGLNAILVVGGEPARVIASNRDEWNNLLVSELPYGGVAEDLLAAIANNRPHSDFSREAGHEQLFDYTAPMLLSNLSQGSDQVLPPQRGAVMIHLETARIERDIITATLRLTLVLTLIAIVLLLIIYGLLKRLVLDPAQHIVEVVHAQQAGQRQARTGHLGGDEIRFIGQRLDVMLDSLQEREALLSAASDAANAASHAKSAFLANMSHEIRTPMNAVLGFARLLRDLPLTEQQRDYVSAIATSGEALLALINDILDYSKIEAGRLDLERISFDPRQPFEDALEVMARTANDKGVELTGVLHSSLALNLMGDPGRLRQVVLNLLSNAIKFTQVGTVVLRATIIPDEDQQLHLQFSVQDTGMGMDEAAIKRLFQPFTQADVSTTRRFGGTGLGLSICRRIVDRMQGVITVDSQPGEGTRFSVQIPVQLAETQPTGGMSYPDLEGRRALLLDDNPLVREVLQAQLQRWDMDVICCERAEDAGRALNTLSTLDVLLIDDQRPEGDALSFCQVLQNDERWSNLPIILLSQSNPDASPPPISRVYARLIKPFRSQQLLQNLQSLFAKGGEIEPASATPQPSEAMIPSPGLPVLVVEDNPINQKVIVLMLEKLGYQVALANNGLEALAAAEQAQFQLVFMDCQMPEMDGLEATRQLRASGYVVPIVALTANAFDSDREACLAAGMNDFLTKPVMPDKLKQVLAAWGASANTPN